MSTNHDNIKKNYVFCSVCGEPLFKGKVAKGLETTCPRCKSELLIDCMKGMVSVRELQISCRAER